MKIFIIFNAKFINFNTNCYRISAKNSAGGPASEPSPSSEFGDFLALSGSPKCRHVFVNSSCASFSSSLSASSWAFARYENLPAAAYRIHHF